MASATGMIRVLSTSMSMPTASPANAGITIRNVGNPTKPLLVPLRANAIVAARTLPRTPRAAAHASPSATITIAATA